MLPLWKQMKRLCELGFDEAAGFSKSEFEKYLPGKNLAVDSSKDGLLVVSERCVGIAKQCELLGIRNEIRMDEHRDELKTPKTILYMIYSAQSGLESLGFSAAVALENFKAAKRRPCTTVEVLAIYREIYSENLENIYHGDADKSKVKTSRFIDAAGSRVGEGMVPTLFFDRNRQPYGQRLMAYEDLNKNFEHSGVASCSSE